MSEVQSQFQLLLMQVRTGDESAARQLFEQYSQHVIRVVRRQLHPALRRRFDSADIAQSVWASFFGAARDEFKFQNPAELIGFLCNVARHKTIDQYRRQARTGKRQLRRERPLNDHQLGDPNQCTASKITMAEDRWERLLRDQPPTVRAILSLKRLGYTPEEIAERLSLHPRTVRRQLQKLSENRDDG